MDNCWLLPFITCTWFTKVKLISPLTISQVERHRNTGRKILEPCLCSLCCLVFGRLSQENWWICEYPRLESSKQLVIPSPIVMAMRIMCVFVWKINGIVFGGRILWDHRIDFCRCIDRKIPASLGCKRKHQMTNHSSFFKMVQNTVDCSIPSYLDHSVYMDVISQQT